MNGDGLFHQYVAAALQCGNRLRRMVRVRCENHGHVGPHFSQHRLVIVVEGAAQVVGSLSVAGGGTAVRSHQIHRFQRQGRAMHRQNTGSHPNNRMPQTR